MAVVDRVAAFVSQPDAKRFAELACEAFAFQYAHIEAFRHLCDRRGLRPGAVTDWRQIPAVPTTAFASLTLAAAPAREIFRSSGTSGGARSVHHHPFPALYRQVIDASFPVFCPPARHRPPLLSLIPSRAQLPDSSLGFMADHILQHYGGPHSRTAFGPHGVETAAATAWSQQRQEEGRPAFILATAFALVQWTDTLAAMDQHLDLPAGTAIFETGGFKGRVQEISREALLARLETWLGVPPQRVVREYGMTELTSQLYDRTLLGGPPDILVGPAWTRVRLLDPETLAEAAPGAPGVVAIFDLANIGSAIHLLTGDMGVADGDGFRLLGRASDAVLRGCSLTVEELASGGGASAS